MPQTPKKTTTAPQDLSEWDKGYRGEVPDPTPNANYTVAGSVKGAPTPETEREPAGTEPDTGGEG